MIQEVDDGFGGLLRLDWRCSPPPTGTPFFAVDEEWLVDDDGVPRRVIKAWRQRRPAAGVGIALLVLSGLRAEHDSPTDPTALL